MLLVYGVVMPFTVARLLPAELSTLLQPFIPPRFLLGGFLLGVLLMADRPTGMEEELGEMVFALCFLMFLLYRYLTPEVEASHN